MAIRAVVFDIGGVFFPWPTEAYFMEWGERRGLGELLGEPPSPR